MANYIVLDIGGTNIRLAKTSTLDNFVISDAQNFILSHNFTTDFAQLISEIKNLSGARITALGLATTGQLDENRQVLLSARNLPEWAGVDLHGRLAETFDCPVFIANDAVAAAWAEIYYGPEANKEFMLIIWGTGIGGASVKISPQLQVKEIDSGKYLAALEGRCGGRAILNKFGRKATDLIDKEWEGVSQDFFSSLKAVAENLGHNKIIFVGGVALKQQQRLLAAGPQILGNDVNFLFTELGENFGLYGAVAIIKNNLA